MTRACKSAPSDTVAQDLCRYFTGTKKFTRSMLDTGVLAIQFKATPLKASIDPKTKGNKLIEFGELSEKAAKLIEQEHAPTAYHRYSKQSLSYLVSHKKHLQKKHLSEVVPPWILDDFNSRTKSDELIVKRVMAGIKKIRASITGLTPGTRAYNEKLAKKLGAWVVRPKSKGGLGVTPVSLSPSAVNKARTALQLLALKNPKAHCIEISYILYEVYRLAGLKPKYYLAYKDLNGATSVTHMCIGLHLDPKRPSAVTLIDPTVDPTMTSPEKWFNTPHKKVIPLSLSEVVGLHYNNRGIALYRQNAHKYEIPKPTKKSIMTFFKKGQRYAPYYPLMPYNLATYHRFVDVNFRELMRYVKKALELYPRYQDALGLKSDVTRKRSKSRTTVKIPLFR